METTPAYLGTGTAVVLFLAFLMVTFAVTEGANWRRFSRPGSERLPMPIQWLYAGTSWTVDAMASVFIHLRIKPDQISWMGWVMGCLTCLFVAGNQFEAAMVAIYFSGFFDVMDGIVAKRTNTATRAGAALDSFLDRSADFFYHAGALWLWRDSAALIFVNLAALHGSTLVSYTSALAEKHNISLPRGYMRRADRGALLLIGITLSAFSANLEHANELPPGTPLAVAMLLIAVAANISAFWRLSEVRRNLSSVESGHD